MSTLLEINEFPGRGETQEANVVSNKKYVDNNFLNKNITGLTLNDINLIDNDENQYIIKPYYSSSEGSYLVFLKDIYPILKIYSDKILFLKDLMFTTYGIYFNKNDINGSISSADMQETYLKNLITSTTTETQLTYLNTNNLLDNVVPTYKFCEGNYVKNSSMNYKIYKPLTQSVILSNIKKINTENATDFTDLDQLESASLLSFYFVILTK